MLVLARKHNESVRLVYTGSQPLLPGTELGTVKVCRIDGNVVKVGFDLLNGEDNKISVARDDVINDQPRFKA